MGRKAAPRKYLKKDVPVLHTSDDQCIVRWQRPPRWIPLGPILVQKLQSGEGRKQFFPALFCFLGGAQTFWHQPSAAPSTTSGTGLHVMSCCAQQTHPNGIHLVFAGLRGTNFAALIFGLKYWGNEGKTWCMFEVWRSPFTVRLDRRARSATIGPFGQTQQSRSDGAQVVRTTCHLSSTEPHHTLCVATTHNPRSVWIRATIHVSCGPLWTTATINVFVWPRGPGIWFGLVQMPWGDVQGSPLGRWICGGPEGTGSWQFFVWHWRHRWWWCDVLQRTSHHKFTFGTGKRGLRGGDLGLELKRLDRS